LNRLSCHTNTHPLALSGGEKQRVAIGGAACAAKDILIYDEPAGGQDHLNMRATCAVIRGAAQNAKYPLSLPAIWNLFWGAVPGCRASLAAVWRKITA
jgi:ABC-type lipoprotein export system ATPase subunit